MNLWSLFQQNKKLEFIKIQVDILKDCVDSINFIIKNNNKIRIEPDNIPNKIVLLNHYIKKNKVTNKNIRKKIFNHVYDDISIYIDRLYSIHFEDILKYSEYRINIISNYLCFIIIYFNKSYNL